MYNVPHYFYAQSTSIPTDLIVRDKCSPDHIFTHPTAWSHLVQLMKQLHTLEMVHAEFGAQIEPQFTGYSLQKSTSSFKPRLPTNPH